MDKKFKEIYNIDQWLTKALLAERKAIANHAEKIIADGKDTTELALNLGHSYRDDIAQYGKALKFYQLSLGIY
ncbi:MAG: hypothetical protein MRQ09_00670 [Candidatus Midichloria sp.]|nr:hypothetical protein [Candidatus Midichloria sp.]